MNDAMLNKRDKKEKVYQVEMNKTPSDDQLAEMSRGEGVLSCCHDVCAYAHTQRGCNVSMYRSCHGLIGSCHGLIGRCRNHHSHTEG